MKKLQEKYQKIIEIIDRSLNSCECYTKLTKELMKK